MTASSAEVLATAREQVLEGGVGLSRAQVLEVLRLPDTALDDLLELAHQVRLAWCGPEVEVEDIISLKTGGCPEGCHFCSQSGLFASPVRSAWRAEFAAQLASPVAVSSPWAISAPARACWAASTP